MSIGANILFCGRNMSTIIFHSYSWEKHVPFLNGRVPYSTYTIQLLNLKNIGNKCWNKADNIFRCSNSHLQLEPCAVPIFSAPWFGSLFPILRFPWNHLKMLPPFGIQRETSMCSFLIRTLRRRGSNNDIDIGL